MKKYIVLCILYFFSTSNSLAQTSLPPVYEIKSDTALIQIPDSSFWQKLEDKEGKWSIADVSNLPLSQKFHTSGLKADGIDTNNIHTYWQRYRLKNIMDKEAAISLTAPVDYFDVFIIKNDSLQAQYHSGFLQEWDKKDGLKSAFFAGAINLVIKPGEEILIYNRKHRNVVTNFKTGVYFYNTEKLIRNEYVDSVDNRLNYFGKIHLQEAFVLGLLLLAIFINLLFYKIVREKVYLYFALFALFLGINRLWNISSVYFRWEHPAWSEYVAIIGYAWAVIPIFLIQFFRHFLKTKVAYPWWDKLLLSLGILNTVAYIIAFVARVVIKKMPAFFAPIPSLLAFFIIPVCIIITLLLFVQKRDRSIRYLIFGAFPLLLLYSFSGPSEVFELNIKFLEPVMNNFRLVEVVCISWLVLSFSLILLMRFDRLRKENAQQALDNERLAREKEIERTELIEKQKAELEIQVEERTADLKRSLEDLKSTQSQLIQSEKMASLGELTAGIAHEIQNPLNFVNNFSEVSNELIDEMNEELDKGDIEEAKAISSDIKQNLEKINRHGKRADAIVKGMLQHSRTSSGQKEPTNINALADEYLRLAYHGLRAKDKSFNAALKTDYDETIGNVNIIPQDIGRVILNLITNAFYVVDEKKKALAGKSSFENLTSLYEPTVSVSTKKDGNKVLISVKDNGNGIPQKVLDKIFQPFFTTKPTGQGTGLGLSLSYDIIKAHGGELKVDTREGEFAEFVITLPV